MFGIRYSMFIVDSSKLICTLNAYLSLAAASTVL